MKIRIEILDEDNKIISSSTISENKTKYITESKQWDDIVSKLIKGDF